MPRGGFSDEAITDIIDLHLLGWDVEIISREMKIRESLIFDLMDSPEYRAKAKQYVSGFDAHQLANHIWGMNVCNVTQAYMLKGERVTSKEIARRVCEYLDLIDFPKPCFCGEVV